MSKKSKRLEKENEAYKKQKEASNANILRMAAEREELRKKVEYDDRQMETLRGIIQAMQRQGRAVPPSLTNTLESCFSDSHGGGEGDEESDYSVEAEEEEEVSEFDDDTEEEGQPPEQAAAPVTYGPERPPQPQPAASVNGH